MILISSGSYKLHQKQDWTSTHVLSQVCRKHIEFIQLKTFFFIKFKISKICHPNKSQVICFKSFDSPLPSRGTCVIDHLRDWGLSINHTFPQNSTPWPMWTKLDGSLYFLRLRTEPSRKFQNRPLATISPL